MDADDEAVEVDIVEAPDSSMFIEAMVELSCSRKGIKRLFISYAERGISSVSRFGVDVPAAIFFLPGCSKFSVTDHSPTMSVSSLLKESSSHHIFTHSCHKL